MPAGATLVLLHEHVGILPCLLHTAFKHMHSNSNSTEHIHTHTCRIGRFTTHDAHARPYEFLITSRHSLTELHTKTGGLLWPWTRMSLLDYYGRTEQLCVKLASSAVFPRIASHAPVLCCFLGPKTPKPIASFLSFPSFVFSVLRSAFCSFLWCSALNLKSILVHGRSRWRSEFTGLGGADGYSSLF